VVVVYVAWSESEGEMDIREIALGDLEPNPWNPNRMDEVTYAKLKAYLKQRGLVEPLIVREAGEKFQILGGFHRWRAAGELGYQTVPCNVLVLGDREAKILSINLNELKGEPVQALFARLIADLSSELSMEDLETHLPYSEAELKDALELSKISDALPLDLDEEEAEAEATRPKIVSFVIEGDEEELLETAIARASEAAGGVSRSKAMMMVVRGYLGEIDG
jgi:ParB-like chromosome segregation protein Spo0J